MTITQLGRTEMELVNSIDVTWSGRYPSLCYGNWKIKINGKVLPIPEEKADCHMDTLGSYQEWHFVERMEEFSDYTDGMGEGDWLDKNSSWISIELEKMGIEFSRDNWSELYDKIQESDFRPGSCGGCI